MSSEEPHAANMDVFLDIEIKDPQGNVISKTHKRAESFVANFIYMIFNLLTVSSVATTGAMTPVNTNGSSSSGGYPLLSATSQPLMYSLATSASSNYGVWIGTSTTTPTATDYTLGTNVTTFSYGNTLSTTPSIAGKTTSFTIYRNFTNNTAGSVTIQEAGLVVQNTNVNGTFYTLVLHDLTGAQAVGVGNSITITYTIQTTT